MSQGFDGPPLLITQYIDCEDIISAIEGIDSLG